MKFGYARVSTKEQNLSLQVDALKKEGCQQIYQEKMSGGKAEGKLKGGDLTLADLIVDSSKKKKAWISFSPHKKTAILKVGRIALFIRL